MTLRPDADRLAGILEEIDQQARQIRYAVEEYYRAFPEIPRADMFVESVMKPCSEILTRTRVGLTIIDG